MRHTRVVTVKYAMSALMIALKELEIKVEAIPVRMHHEHTATKQMKYKGEIPTGTVHM